jgi:hypothetical protein
MTVQPRKKGTCTFVSSLKLLMKLARKINKIIINMFLFCLSCRLSQLSWLSRLSLKIIAELKLNSTSLCSSLRISKLLVACLSKKLSRSFPLIVLRRFEKISSFINFQSHLFICLPSFNAQITWIGSLTSCPRSKKLFLYCSHRLFTGGKFMIGLKPAKEKP